ncbi:MAG: PHP domain-containing protein [Nanoarchaeota archaeon]|nr:PHP domain-containing protein [Nanoarchaeota archaeon]
MINADFHIHTFFSKCSNMDPKDLVKKAIFENLDVIGVVDHDSIKGGLAAKRIAGKRIMVIPGEEIDTAEGEIIVFFSDGKYRGNIVEICERAKQENAFIFAPHPFDFLRHSLGSNINAIKGYLNAVETFNSRCMFSSANGKAKKYADENSIPALGGSDAHFPEEIGNVFCKMSCEKNIGSILESIKKRKIEITGRKSPITMHARTHFVKFNRKFSRFSLSE